VRGEDYRRIDRLATARREQSQQPFDLPVLNLLQAVQPVQMMRAKCLDIGDKLLPLIIVINGVRSRWDLDRACVGQQMVPGAQAFLPFLP
jgi:hypothetical protein